MGFFINTQQLNSFPKVLDKNSLKPTCSNFGSKYTIYQGCIKCWMATLEGGGDKGSDFPLTGKNPHRVRPSFQKH